MLTALLAMVAFKYVISEKLPNISYATLIDFYVLLCFHSAFLIIILQMLSRPQAQASPQSRSLTLL